MKKNYDIEVAIDDPKEKVNMYTIMEKIEQQEEYVKKFEERMREEHPEKMAEIVQLNNEVKENRIKYQERQKEIYNKINTIYGEILYLDQLVGTVIDISDDYDMRYLKINDFRKEHDCIALYGTLVSATKNSTSKDDDFEFTFRNSWEHIIEFEDVPKLKFVTKEQFLHLIMDVLV